MNSDEVVEMEIDQVDDAVQMSSDQLTSDQLTMTDISELDEKTLDDSIEIMSDDLNSSKNDSQELSSSEAKSSGKRRKLTDSERKKLKEEHERRKMERENMLRTRRIEKERILKEKKEKRIKLEKEREDKKKQLELEKAEKQRQLESQKAIKQKQLEEEKLAKEDKMRQKELERLKRQKENDLKQEERLKREEEKLKKLEEKSRMEEEERKLHEKAKNKFISFFKSGVSTNENENAPKDERNDLKSEQSEYFLPFQLKPNQKLAPVFNDIAKDRFVMGAFDATIKRQDVRSDELYICLLKRKIEIPTKCDGKYFTRKCSPDVIGEDDEHVQKHRAKFLQFHDNRRPAYYGTWQKKSTTISGKCPLGKDKIFDYEEDSDDDWEDKGEDDESINDSNSDNDVSKDDEYEIDDDLFVPHGYLSPDEDSENENGNSDCVEDGEKSTNNKRSLLDENILISERKTKLQHMKPIVIGPIWEDEHDPNDPIMKSLEAFRAVLNI